MVCHHPYIFCKLRLQYSVCTGYHDLTALCIVLGMLLLWLLKVFIIFFAMHGIKLDYGTGAYQKMRKKE